MKQVQGEETRIRRFLVYAPDAAMCPFELIPDDNLINRLYMFLNHEEGPIAMKFDEKDTLALIHLGPDLITGTGVIKTNGIRSLPGGTTLLEKFSPISESTAKQLAEDVRADNVRSLQTADSKLKALVKEMSDREMEGETDSTDVDEGSKR